ncbi:MAG: hypothetical protein HOP18_11865 [Deltaproteobacteria bacterium]|nr:hypothetical protein [Deltaproteobacteria bacterium]
MRAEHQTTRELAEQCLSLAQNEQDPILLLGAYLELGSASFSLGELAQALQQLGQGMSLYNPQERSAHIRLYGYDLGVSCFARAASVLWLMGYVDQALQKVREALTLAQQRAHPFSVTYALSFAVECHRLRREAHATQERAEAVLALATEQSFPLWAAAATIYRGWALAEQGQSEEGITQIRAGLSSWRATGAEVGLPSWLGQLAEAYGVAGQIEAGSTTLNEALAIVQQTEERWWEGELYRLKGELTLQQENQKAKGKNQKLKIPEPKFQILNPQAEAYFLKAIEVARKQQAKSLELRATVSLARLWQQQGKRPEAHDLLSEIYNWFTEGFDTKDLQEAKTLLNELA